MNTTQTHPLALDYLDRLRAESRRLPTDQATELVADMQAHLAEALPPGATEAQVRQVLDRLGAPAVLVAEAGGGAPAGAPAPAGRPDTGSREAGALLLLLGSVLMVWLWPVALVLWGIGLYLLLTAPRWGLADQLLGGIVLGAAPAVLALAGLMSWATTGSSEACEAGSDGVEHCVRSGEAGMTTGGYVALVLLALYLVLLVYTLVRLVRAARRPVATR